MKQSIVLTKVNDLFGSFASGSVAGKVKLGSFKFDVKSIFRKFVIPFLSILLFIGLWQLGSKALFNMEADYKIEKALADQGAEAADAMRLYRLWGY